MIILLQQFELTTLDFIQNYRNPLLDKIMPIISALGDNGLIWILIAILLLIWKKERVSGITLTVALIIDLLVCNIILKPLIHRIRPYDITNITLLVDRLTDYSFPSGHTAAAFASAVVLYSVRKSWGICAYVVATLIALSRLYLYVHYPTDVLAGAIIGAMCGLTALHLVNVILSKRHKDP